MPISNPQSRYTPIDYYKIKNNIKKRYLINIFKRLNTKSIDSFASKKLKPTENE